MVSFTVSALAQKRLWNELNAKIFTLYRKEQHLEAAKITEKVLLVAKKTFGEDRPDVVQSFNNLALLYQKRR